MGDRDDRRRGSFQQDPKAGRKDFSDRGSGGARDQSSDPPLDEDAQASDLDGFVRSRLRMLSGGAADRVGRHLVMAGRLLESDPDLAYQHAQAALRRAGRVDVVREAAALTAYAAGRYGEALREVRAVRRLSGVDNLRAIEADCERGLGRPERALGLSGAPASKDMTTADRIELAIVASGARLDMAQPEAALLELDAPIMQATKEATILNRVAQARASVLRAMGRDDEARQLEASVPGEDHEDDEILLFTAAPAEEAGGAGTGDDDA